MNWSGGKDSCMALYKTLQSGEWSVQALMTTFQLDVQTDVDRVSHHEVPSSLMKAQAESLGLRLDEIYLPDLPEREEYEGIMRKALNLWSDYGIRNAIFGDIFLEDLRKHREDNLSMAGWAAHFPLWKQDTWSLAREFIGLGFKAIVVSVDGEKLGPDYCGRSYDESFLSDLPEGVDPCGEHGEFHTFVYDGPMFQKPVLFRPLETKTRNYQWEGKSQDFHYLVLEAN